MSDLARLLAPYNYVVLRNFQSLPDLMPGHDDIDIFVSEEDYEVVKELTKDWVPKVDIRHSTDKYFPQQVITLLLFDQREHNGFKIPSRKAYFVSLYYHAKLHKQENKYEEELKRAFFDWITPIRAEDPGVGYFLDSNLPPS